MWNVHPNKQSKEPSDRVEALISSAHWASGLRKGRLCESLVFSRYATYKVRLPEHHEYKWCRRRKSRASGYWLGRAGPQQRALWMRRSACQSRTSVLFRWVLRSHVGCGTALASSTTVAVFRHCPLDEDNALHRNSFCRQFSCRLLNLRTLWLWQCLFALLYGWAHGNCALAFRKVQVVSTSTNFMLLS